MPSIIFLSDQDEDTGKNILAKTIKISHFIAMGIISKWRKSDKLRGNLEEF